MGDQAMAASGARALLGRTDPSLDHFDITAFMSAAVGVFGFLSVSLLVFGHLRVGSIVAFLAAGLAIGWFRDIPAATVLALREFSELGVILLLFLIGIEMKPSELRRLGRDVVAFGVPQIALTAAVIAGYFWLRSNNWAMASVIGMGFALSSTTIVVQLLKDRGEFQSGWGRKAFAILIAQDLAIVPFLLVVSLLAEESVGVTQDGSWVRAALAAGVVVIGIMAIGRFVMPWLLSIASGQKNTPAFVCLTLLGILTAALAAEAVGLSMALGAFLLGATLSTSSHGHDIQSVIEPCKGVLLALFFLSVGLSIDLHIVSTAWASLLANTALVVAIKIGVLIAIALALRLAFADALRLSIALAQCGEFGFVLFAAAQEGNLMTADLTALGSVLISISMLATPFLLQLTDSLRNPSLRATEADPSAGS
jgi:glutathione-regulated potassium-efflux system ancillary protein KefC